MNIGIDGRELTKNGLTGIGRYLHNFLDYAVNEKPEYTFIIYGNQNTTIDIDAPNLQKKITPERNTFIWDNVSLAKRIYRDKVDIFFSPYDKAPIFSPVPKIITIHDLLFVFVPGKEYKARSVYNSVYLFLRKIIAEKAKLIITVSQHSKKDIIKIFKIPAERVKVIPNGVSKNFYPMKDKKIINNIKTRLGIANDYLLYVGNFKPHKNVSYLLKAFALLSNEYKKKYQLILCGKEDNYRQQLEKEVNNLQLTNKVVFTGPVTEDELLAIYNGAKLFVFPSLYEGFGIPPLEAMACGTPIICSNATSIPEVVGNAGILVEPDRPENFSNAITEVLSNQNLYNQLCNKGLNRVKQFSLQKTAQKILSTIECTVYTK